MIEVGTSTWRQISGSVCRNSIRTVAISLTLSDAVFVLAGLMRSVWRPGSGGSRVGAGRVVDIVRSLSGALLGEVQKMPSCCPLQSVGGSGTRRGTSRMAYRIDAGLTLRLQLEGTQFALKGVDMAISLADVRDPNGTLGSLHAESGHSIAAIKLSVIFLLFSQTKQRVSVLDAVSRVALGF